MRTTVKNASLAHPDGRAGDVAIVARNWSVRFTLKNRRRQPGLSGPKSANGGHAGAGLDQAINERTEPRNALPLL
jgi:hypothetical protein